MVLWALTLTEPTDRSINKHMTNERVRRYVPLFSCQSEISWDKVISQIWEMYLGLLWEMNNLQRILQNALQFKMKFW